MWEQERCSVVALWCEQTQARHVGSAGCTSLRPGERIAIEVQCGHKNESQRCKDGLS